MRQLFNILTNFDWISPLFGLTQDAIHIQNKTHVIYIPWKEAESAGWSALQIQQALLVNGVKYWGGVMVNGEYIIKVPMDEAEHAEYVLSKHGIPLK